MIQDFFKQIKKVHFVGIGGVGVSALARMALLQGKKVTGSDTAENPITARIKKFGGRVFIGHQESNLNADTDWVIYSPAVKSDNPELRKARRLKIKTNSYPQALGLISQNLYVIAVAGTHGKTTTTGMVAEILTSAKKSPTAVIGGFLKKQKDNFIPGKSRYFVVEACEYQKSFLSLRPNILIITNIDNDHLDYYDSLKNIQKAFAELISRMPTNSIVVCDPSDPKVKPAIKKAPRLVDYAQEKLTIKLKAPGEHNRRDGQAALAASRLLGINRQTALKALASFAGTGRRFEFLGKTQKSALLYDDYGHHPTEIKATLKACREKFPKQKIFAVFQPHLYSRTRLLLDEFSQSFTDADEVIIADIYAAREKDDGRVHAKDLADKIRQSGIKAQYLADFSGIKNYLRKNAKTGDIILTIGAGDIYRVGQMLKK